LTGIGIVTRPMTPTTLPASADTPNHLARPKAIRTPCDFHCTDWPSLAVPADRAADPKGVQAVTSICTE
jgi:hypothetical protein